MKNPLDKLEGTKLQCSDLFFFFLDMKDKAIYIFINAVGAWILAALLGKVKAQELEMRRMFLRVNLCLIK